MTDETLEQLRMDDDDALKAAVAGMTQALHAERVAMWKEAAEGWLAQQASGTEITADELVASVGLPDVGPHRNNVVGAWFRQQSIRGTLTFAHRLRKSKRVIRHGNLQRVWIVS